VIKKQSVCLMSAVWQQSVAFAATALQSATLLV